MLLRVPGGIVFYDRPNPGGGPALALIHGSGDNHRLWNEQAIHLTAAGYDAIVPDLRGHGSTQTLDGDYSAQAMANDVLSLLDHLGIGKAALAGYSMGGAVATLAAAMRPERLWALVISNSGPQIAAPTAEQAAAADVYLLEHIAAIKERGMEAVWDGYLSQLFTERFRTEQPDAVTAYHRLFLSNDPHEYVRRLIAAPPPAPIAYGRITAPALVIAGEHDPYASPESAQRIAALIADATVAVLPTAHCAMIEAPELYARTLLGFLELRRPSVA